jgi:hypothetical protein
VDLQNMGVEAEVNSWLVQAVQYVQAVQIVSCIPSDETA